jgi:hypothetical protein
LSGSYNGRSSKKSRTHDGPVAERLKVGYHLLSDRLKQCFHYFAAFPENSDLVFDEILFHWTGQGLVPDGPVAERLKVGYHLLSDRLKQCFHYFAAFPENSDIVFDEILFHWTGQGLVPEDYEDDPRAERVSLLTQWWEQSFIETNGPFGSDQCYLLNLKMHDVMRDLGFYLLEKDCGTSHAKQRYLYRPGRNLEQVPHEWKVISEPPESECTTILEAISLSLDTNKLETIPDYTQVRDYIRYYG